MLQNKDILCRYIVLPDHLATRKNYSGSMQIEILFGVAGRLKSKPKRNRIKRILKAIAREIDQENNFPDFQNCQNRNEKAPARKIVIGLIGRVCLEQTEHKERKRLMEQLLRQIQEKIEFQ